MMSLLGRHLSGLVTFSGREPRQPFWLWVLIVMVTAMLLWFAAFASIMGEMVGSIDQFAREHPDQVTRSVGPDGFSIHVDGLHPELAPDFTGLVIAITLISLLVIALLAAAVARRLHDGGRSGWWGALPVPFLFTGFGVMALLFSSAGPASGGAPDAIFRYLPVLMANNLLYLASLITVIVLCVRPSDPGENRYGGSGETER